MLDEILEMHGSPVDDDTIDDLAALSPDKLACVHRAMRFAAEGGSDADAIRIAGGGSPGDSDLVDNTDHVDDDGPSPDEVKRLHDRLKPPCYVQAGKTAREACPVGSAGRGDMFEDLVLSKDVVERMIMAGFDAEANGGSYQDAFRAQLETEQAQQHASRARGDQMSDCNCGNPHTDGEHVDAEQTDFETDQEYTRRVSRRVSREQLGQPGSAARGDRTDATRSDLSEDDSDEIAAKARLAAANRDAWSRR